MPSSRASPPDVVLIYKNGIFSFSVDFFIVTQPLFLLCECFCSLRLFALRVAETYTHQSCGMAMFLERFAKIMYPGHKEDEQNEKQYYSEEYWQFETLTRKSAPQPGVPPRALLHPSELPIVRPKNTRRLSNQEQITPFDGLGTGLDSTDLAELEISPRRTDDLLTQHIFHNVEDSVPIDEIGTLPPNVQAQLHRTEAAYEPSTLPEIDPLSTISLQREREEVFSQVETQQLAAARLPTGIEKAAQSQEFSSWHGFDKVCWWLLSPGQLEFLLWFIGVIVLVCLTSFFLLVIMVSLGHVIW